MATSQRLIGALLSVLGRVASRVAVSLILALLALVSTWLFSGEARAYGPTNGQWGVYPCWAGTLAWMPSKGSCAMSKLDIRDADAEAWLVQQRNTYTGYSFTFDSWVACADADGSSCSWKFRKTLKTDSNNYSIITTSMGYANNPQNQQKCEGTGYQSLPNGSCVCSPGYEPDASGACVPKVCPDPGPIPGSDAWGWGYDNMASGGNFVCFDGCLLAGSTGVGYDGKWFIWGPFHNTGQVCNPSNQGGTHPPAGDPQNSGAPPPETNPGCEPGQCSGTVNGTQVCVACDSTGTGQYTKSGSTPGGTITKTECSGGVCTTTTHDVDGDGNIVGPPTTTTTGSGGGNPQAGAGGCTGADCQQSQTNFCEDNPDSIICKSSTWGGTCAASFTCDGDAVQCAIAKEQHERNCILFVTETADTQKANEAHGAGDQPPGHPFSDPTSTPIDFSSQIDTSDSLSGSCPAGKTLTVQGTTVTLITGAMCDSLAMVGNLIVAFGALLSLFIVFKG